jgi:hypothetical protein
MNIEEVKKQRDHVFETQLRRKLSFPNQSFQSIYNKYENLDRIDVSYDKYNADGSENYKVVDCSVIGIIPDSLADIYNFCYGDPMDEDYYVRNDHET